MITVSNLSTLCKAAAQLGDPTKFSDYLRANACRAQREGKYDAADEIFEAAQAIRPAFAFPEDGPMAANDDTPRFVTVRRHRRRLAA